MGLFNVHGQDTESKHVIAMNQMQMVISTCVLLLQPQISVPWSTKRMQVNIPDTGNFTNQCPEWRRLKPPKKQSNLHILGHLWAHFLTNKYLIKSRN